MITKIENENKWGNKRRETTNKNKEKNKNQISIAMGYINDQIDKNNTINYFNIFKKPAVP